MMGYDEFLKRIKSGYNDFRMNKGVYPKSIKFSENTLQEFSDWIKENYATFESNENYPSSVMGMVITEDNEIPYQEFVLEK